MVALGFIGRNGTGQDAEQEDVRFRQAAFEIVDDRIDAGLGLFGGLAVTSIIGAD